MLRHVSSPLRLYSGAGCLDRLGPELRRVGADRVVLLTSPSLLNTYALTQTVRALGQALITVLPDVQRQSPRRVVENIAVRLTELGADGVAVLGGGSAMVTARAAVIALAEAQPIHGLCSFQDAQGRRQSPRLTRPKIPIVSIPTTPSTAVAKPAAAVLDQGTRLSLFDPKTRPQAIFLDPECLATAPDSLVLSSTANTFVSAVEGFLRCRDPFAEADLRQALRLLGPDRTRIDLAFAAVLCGRATDHTGLGVATVLSHALAAVCGADGGGAKAVLLPHVVKTLSSDERAALNDVLGPRDLSQAMGWLRQPKTLRELGIARDQLGRVVQHFEQDWVSGEASADPMRLLSAAF